MSDKDFDELRAMLHEARADFMIQTAIRLNQIAEFAMGLSQSLGDTSRAEADAAFKKYAHEVIDTL